MISPMNDTILTFSSIFYNANQNVKILKREPELVYPLHGHDFYELVIVVSGQGIHFTESEEVALSPGSLFLIPIGMKHGYKKVQDLVLYNIMIRKELFDLSIYQDLTKMPGFVKLFRPDKGVIVYRLTPVEASSFIALVQIIKKENNQHGGALRGSQALSFATTLTLLVNICRIIQRVPLEESSVKLRMSTVFTYLDDNLSRNVSTEELMEVANMSCSTLNRYFKRVTGLSPIEYHLQKRISNACELIHLTGKSIEQIAELSGFSDASYFSRQFKKVMKMSPSVYRDSWKTWGLNQFTKENPR